MKKSLFKSVFAPVFAGFVITVAVLAGTTPIANAQPYYGQYAYSAYGSCINLTYFQGPGSTDAETGGQVSILQEFLNQTGYLSGVSGTYDNGTLGAVINFQRAYNLPITGTVTTVTLQAINQQSCGAGIGGYGLSYPVTNYSSGNDCYWTGSTYNSTYVCSNTPSYQYVAPVAPIAPVICNNWNSNNYTYYGSSNYCSGYGVRLSSLSASYSYNTATITIQGYGFSASGNTVYFGNSVISTGYSTNGTTLVFTVPTGYASGTYDIRVTNASGASSNALSFIFNNSNWNNNGYNNGTGYWSNGVWYNNGSNDSNYSNPPSLSDISGSSQVSVGSTNTWTVTENNSSQYNNTDVSLIATWGDGSTSTGQTQNNYNSNYGYGYNSNSQTYAFTHVYQTPGTYTLTITATNSAGRSASQTFLVTVSGYGYNQYGYNQVYNYGY